MKQNFLLVGFMVIFIGAGVWIGAIESKKTPLKAQLLSPAKTMQLLEAGKDDAIVIGKGPKQVYVFIDPLCELSQLYLKTLYKQKGAMLSRYTVHLFLHRLESKPSKKLIATILESEYPELLIKQSMVENRACAEIETADPDVEDKVERIAMLGKEIGAYKRPYIIVDGVVITGGEE